MPSFSPQFVPISAIQDNHAQFLFKNNDVLFENQSQLRIHAKSEFKQNLARVTLTFVNKSSFLYQNFVVQHDSGVNLPEENELLRVIVKPADQQTSIQPNGQLQFIVNLECVNDFQHVPQLTVQFSVNSSILNRFNVCLPVFVSKFFESTQMDSQAFFTRWKNLSK